MPYDSGASPSSSGKKPSIAACLPDEAIYKPTSEAPRVITSGTVTLLADMLGPKTPVPRPPVVKSGLPKYFHATAFLSGPTCFASLSIPKLVEVILLPFTLTQPPLL